MDIPNLIKISNQLSGLNNQFDITVCEVFKHYLKDFLLCNNVKLEDGRTAEVIYIHETFAEPVIRTNDGQVIDLNIVKSHTIKGYNI